MENKQVVYIATPAGIIKDAIVSAEKIATKARKEQEDNNE